METVFKELFAQFFLVNTKSKSIIISYSVHHNRRQQRNRFVIQSKQAKIECDSWKMMSLVLFNKTSRQAVNEQYSSYCSLDNPLLYKHLTQLHKDLLVLKKATTHKSYFVLLIAFSYSKMF